MVRRLLLTALATTLAVALPAAAEGDAGFGLPGSDPEGCLPYDLSCATAAADACGMDPGSCIADAEDSASMALTPSPDGTTCRAWDLNMPDANQPLTEMFMLDPEGCIQSFLRRTLGWPPSEVTFATESVPFVETVLSWA